MTHLEVWQQLWSLYRDCYEATYGRLQEGEQPKVTPIVLEEFACRLEAAFRKQHGIAKKTS